LPQRELISRREEVRARRLAGSQPESTHELVALLDELRERVVRAALADAKLERRLRGSRHRVVGVDLRDEKPGPRTKATRVAVEVGVYDYDRDLLLVAVVDARSGAVLRIEDRKGEQPPLASEEEKETMELLLADPELRSLRRRRGLSLVAFPVRATHPRAAHRAFEVFLWSGGRRPQRLAARIVDLSAREVLPYDERAGLPAEREGES